MKKNKNKNKNGASEGENTEATEAASNVQLHELPEGYEERTSNLAGFWNHELGPIHFIPLHAKAFDSHAEELKPAIIIIGHSVGQNKNLVDTDGARVMSEPGDLIGVWYKPGMVRIRDWCNTKVFMQYTGEQDTGKMNPMKTFQVSTPKDAKSQPVYLTEDYRKKSKRVELPFEMKGAKRGPVDDDDENFGDDMPPPRGAPNRNATPESERDA